MSKSILCYGDSKAGKTTSLRTLDPSKTVVFSPLNKGLPFSGSAKNYQIWDKEKCPTGNVIRTSESKVIATWLRYISDKMPSITVCVVDDSTFIPAKALDRKRLEGGFQKYSDISHDFLEIMDVANSLRDDLNVYFMHHIISVGDGITEAKKIKAASFGKFIDEKLHGIESQFEIVLLACKLVDDKNVISYKFKTRDANATVGTPMGMWEEEYIDNDLQAVDQRIRCFYAGDCQEETKS